MGLAAWSARPSLRATASRWKIQMRNTARSVVPTSPVSTIVAT